MPKAISEADYQAASDHLNLVQTALRQQEKIQRYEVDSSTSCRSVWKSKNEAVAEAIERQEEVRLGGSCRTGSGRAEKPAC
ncbi:hypothetical protein ACNKHN_05170 [Shigella flexneri]